MTRARTTSRIANPAPYQGVDFRIPLTAMPPEYSPFMINFLSENGRIRLRPGHGQTQTITGSKPVIAIPYTSGNTVDNIIINPTQTRTSAGTVATSPEITSHQLDYTIWKNRILIAGTNTVVELNPLSPSYTNQMTFTSTATNAQFRRGICSYRERLYVAEGTKLHYGGVGAFGGSSTSFDLQQLINGQAIGVEEFAFSNGFGIDQFLVILSSLGDVLVFSGAFPGDLVSWTLVNKFQVEIPPGNEEFPAELIKIPNDLLINSKYGPQMYSLRQLMQSGESATYYEPFEPIRQLWESFEPATTGFGQSVGYKTAAFWPSKNSICVVATFACNNAGILQDWRDYTSFEVLDNGQLPDLVRGNVVFLMDLNTGSTTMHTFHTPLVSAFWISSESQLRASSNGLLMPGTDRATLLFGADNSAASNDYYQDFGTFNIQSVCLFAPLPAGRVKDLKDMIMYSDMYTDHKDQFFYMANQNFDITPGIFHEYKTYAPDRKVRAHVLPGLNTGNSIVYGIKQGGESPLAFEIYGTDPIFETGGEH